MATVLCIQVEEPSAKFPIAFSTVTLKCIARFFGVLAMVCLLEDCVGVETEGVVRHIPKATWRCRSTTAAT